MKGPAVFYASALATLVILAVAYSRGSEPGADIRIPKQAFAKDLSRICPFDMPSATWCDRGAE